ncbi:hypothetical protein BSKO_10251 [Bryopsis sp. KO-2023]|nr:hypothetical protein BSKO_10251 [Bryopsis sp. KO-2023]
MRCVVAAPLAHTSVNSTSCRKSRIWRFDLQSCRNGNSKWAAKAASKSEQFYGELRNHLNKLPGLRVLSVPAQLSEKRVKQNDRVYVGRNFAFESEWIRYGRVTLIDAGEEAQVCCGAMYLDCMADGPPLVFDALISGGDCWMLSMDFVPLFEDGGEDEKFRKLLRLFSDVIGHYLNVAYESWESSRGKHPPGIVLEKQLAFLEWMETPQHPSSVLIRSHFGIGWFDLLLKSLWKDTHGLSRWGGPLQTRSAYHEIYEDVLKESKGNVQEANEKLIATGLQPLEYLYFNPNPNMWDLDDL